MFIKPMSKFLVHSTLRWKNFSIPFLTGRDASDEIDRAVPVLRWGELIQLIAGDKTLSICLKGRVRCSRHRWR